MLNRLKRTLTEAREGLAKAIMTGDDAAIAAWAKRYMIEGADYREAARAAAFMTPGCRHLTDTDLERHYLGMIADRSEFEAVEEHLLVCRDCVDRAEGTAKYVDLMRKAAIQGNFDHL